MLAIFNILFPIISIILLGVVVRQLRLFPDNFFPAVNRLVFIFGITPLLFIKTASMSVSYREVLPSVLVLMAHVLVLALLAWGAAGVFALRRESIASFVHASIRGNYAYVGLPVIYYAFAHTPAEGSSAGIAILIFTPTIIFHNILAVLFLRHYNGRDGKEGYAHLVRSILTDPLVMACALGLAVNIMGVHVPLAFARTCESLGGMALPLALMGIGATMDPALLRGALFPPLGAAFIKTFIGPIAVCGLITAAGIGMNTVHAQILLLLSACSIGVSTYVVTEHYGGDGRLVGSAIFISAIMSMVSLSGILIIISP